MGPATPDVMLGACVIPAHAQCHLSRPPLRGRGGDLRRMSRIVATNLGISPCLWEMHVAIGELKVSIFTSGKSIWRSHNPRTLVALLYIIFETRNDIPSFLYVLIF